MVLIKGEKYMILHRRFWRAKNALLIISLLFVSIFYPITSSTSTVSFTEGLNTEDGVYYTSTFEDVDKFFDGCIPSVHGNKLILDPEGSEYNNYNFSQWTTDSPHAVFEGRFPWFSPFIQLPWVMNLFGTKVEEEMYYQAMSEEDGYMYPYDHRVTYSPFQHFHHFRFKITQNVRTISSFNITWIGNAEDFKNIALYTWKPSIMSLGNWIELDRITSNSTSITLTYEDEDIGLDDDDYLDLIVVVVPLAGEATFIQTEYINIKVQGTGYAKEGAARFRPIKPDNISQWERFTWSGYDRSLTSLSFQFFHEENGSYSLIDNKIIPGNSNGISDAVVDLSGLSNTTNLTVNVTLETNDLSVTPELYSWGVSWQTSDEQWMDQFSSDLRVEKNKIQNIRITDGKATLVTTVYDWPMFGQNPTNNRVSSGFGPGISDSLCWESKEKVGGNQKNPIVSNGLLYVSNSLSSRIYAYDTEYESSYVPNSRIDYSNILGYDIKNSPAATSKNTIIVATGSSQAGGGIENKIFSLNANNLQIQEWDFSYGSVDPSDPGISYESSPVIKDEKIFLTSWNGDSSLFAGIFDFFNFSRGNNKLICLTDEGSFEWDQDLPAGSLSSPVVGEDIVIVGCEKLNGESLQAFSLAGTRIWGVDVGPVGYASPVIYDDMVYVVSKRIPTFYGLPIGTVSTQVMAVDINGGTIKWNTTIGGILPESYMNAAYSSPVVVNGFVYAASPDGMFYKIDANNGEIVNSIRIFTKGVSTNVVQSSPAYADEILYIGTPDGYIQAINADTLEVIWKRRITSDPIFSSPVLADGFVYYIDDAGLLYCRGKRAISDDEPITGELISMPITLPDDDLYWNRFSVSDETGSGNIKYSVLRENFAVLIDTINNNERLSNDILKNLDTIRLKATFNAKAKETVSLDSWHVTFTDEIHEDGETVFSNFQKNMTLPAVFSVDVQNKVDGLINSSARFKLEYSNESTGTVETNWLPANFTGENETKNKETIRVNMSYFEFTDEIDLYHQIRFSIDDVLSSTSYSNWFTIEGRPDVNPPMFIIDSFSPDPPYISSLTPTCRIQARDLASNGNISGINVDSARYTITYEDDGTEKEHTQQAACTGINGTKDIVTITADISESNVSDDITRLNSILFYIEDMNGNTNQTDWIELFYDDAPPSSTITNKDEIPSISNATSILIKTSATDNDTDEEYVSGVKDISLYYRKRDSASWKTFDSCNRSECEWEFTIGSKDGGEYELCTIATDNAGNREEFPDEGEVFFLYDPNPPWVLFTDEINDITDDSQPPSFDQVTFEDDYKLHKMYYRLDFEEDTNWTLITTTTNNKITPEWSLTQEQWETIVEDQVTFVLFKVIDSLDNVFITPSTNDAMRIRKNLEDDSDIDDFTLDISDFQSWQWDNTYKIKVDTKNVTVSSMILWYRFAGDDENTTNNWTQYEEMRNASPFEWTFSPKDGNGYYQFYVEVNTPSDEVVTTSVETVYITLFPIIELLVALVVTMVLFAVSGMVIKKYRHTKKEKNKPFL